MIKLHKILIYSLIVKNACRKFKGIHIKIVKIVIVNLQIKYKYFQFKKNKSIKKIFQIHFKKKYYIIRKNVIPL